MNNLIKVLEVMSGNNSWSASTFDSDKGRLVLFVWTSDSVIITEKAFLKLKVTSKKFGEATELNIIE